MAFETGTATSPANLKSTIETFAIANGWTLDGGSDALSKGASHVRLTAVSSENLEIEGANAANMTTGLCPQKAMITIAATQWPVTYRAFSLGTPDFIAVALQYAVDRNQFLWWGEIAKYAAAAWTGGNWFGASAGIQSGQQFHIQPTVAGPFDSNTQGRMPGAPFWGTQNRNDISGAFTRYRGAFLHAEIDGFTWPGANDNLAWPSFPELGDPIHAAPRQPNLWNAHSALLPHWLFYKRSDNFYSPLGHLEHMRIVTIANYNLAEIITIGSDSWMVFPWGRKNAAAPNGGLDANLNNDHTGTFGVAIEYDGP